MKQVILRIVLKSGAVIQHVLTEVEARNWVKDYKDGRLHGKVSDPAGWFSIDAAEISAVQYCEIPPEMGQQSYPGAGLKPWGRSGN